mgnify:CR=1 FL=1|tara:strand:- start:567 stop:1943 length:1377 start_codon:yes stop_codon:yes gene_type:complete
MAWVQVYDGADDYALFDSTIVNSGAFTYVIKFKFDTVAVDNFVMGATSSTGNWIGWFNGNFTIRISGGSFNLPNAPVADVWYTLTLDRTAANAVTISEPLLGSVSGSRSGNVIFNQFGRFSTSATLIFDGQLEYATLTSPESNNNWDATASSHAAGTPILTDTISGNNATGVNMATGGTVANGGVWLDLGGGGISVTANYYQILMAETKMQKNIASQKFIVFAFDTTTNLPILGDAANITATISKDFAAGSSTNDVNPTETQEGFYAFDALQAETNANNIQIFPSSVTANIQVISVPGLITTTPVNFGDDIIQTADNDVKISALNDFDPSTDTVANVTLVATTTTNTDMKGTDGANTVVPPSVAQFNARSIVSADYFLVTDYTAPDNVSITSILADTNELQLNQGDWLTATGFSTLVATDIITGGAITTSGGVASVDIKKVNAVTIIGAGTSGDLWRA